METRGRMHYHHHTPNPHLMHMKDARWDVGQMLTPPKSKSPWEAMTSGSTGGWAAPLGPSNPYNPNDPKGTGWMGPLGTALAGLIPIVGPFISAGMGAAGSIGGGSGFQGTDKGWKNLVPTLGGALGGWGLGGLGKGIAGGIGSAIGGGTSGGIGSMLGNFGTGFGQGVNSYMGTTTGPFKALGKGISSMFGGIGGGGSGGATPMSTGAKWAASLPKSGFAQAANLSSAASPYTGAGYNASTMLGGGGFTGSFATPQSAMLSYGGLTPADSLLGQGASASGAATGNAFANAAAAGAAGGDKSWGSSMLDFLKPQNLAGLALMGSSALPTNAQYQSPELMGTMTAKLLGGKGITDIGVKSQEELMKIMSRDPSYGMQAMDPWLTRAGAKLDETYADAEKALTKKFKGYGATDSREFMQEMRKLQENKAAEKSALQYEAQQREYVRVQNQQYDAVKTSLGVDDATMKDLLGLTQLSVEEAGLKYGAAAADVASLREALGLGGAAMLNMGNPTYNVYGSNMLNDSYAGLSSYNI